MRGQWIGNFTGSYKGLLMLNIDELENNYEGVAYVIPENVELIPPTVATFSTRDKSYKQELISTSIVAVDPRTWFRCGWDTIKHLYTKDVSISNEAEGSIELKDNKLHINIKTDIKVNLLCVIGKSELGYSKITGSKMSWNQFKNHIEDRQKSKYLYRGQQEPWRLSTAYHRRGRYRMNQFTDVDIKQLHRRLSAITSHYFDLLDSDGNRERTE